MPLSYVRELCAYWADGYDWRATEARLNALPQFRTEIDGLGIHFLHVRSPHAGRAAAGLTHGWPGSIVEFLKVLGPLTDPPRTAARGDAFHVVCPSLPGLRVQRQAGRPGWGVERIAAAWATLMAPARLRPLRRAGRRLGHQRHDEPRRSSDPTHVAGIHLIMPLAPPDPATFDDLDRAGARRVAVSASTAAVGPGYSMEQSTRPQTLGYGLVDSPAALCAWIVEKFRAWTDCDGHPEKAFTRDELLDNVMLYWLPGTGASSARLYWESFKGSSGSRARPSTRHGADGLLDLPEGDPPPVAPLGRAALHRHALLERADRGGHFAAFEQPELFVDELRAFFRPVR